MCYPVQCSKCGKTTWAGCGKHKDMVMAKVPENERCLCPREGESQPKTVENKVEKLRSSIHEIKSEDEFNKLIKENKVIVIDFFASWCTSCKQFAPIFEKVSEKCKNEKLNVMFAKLNGDEVSEVIDALEIDAYPTFMIYKNGNLALSKKGKILENEFFEDIKKQL